MAPKAASGSEPEASSSKPSSKPAPSPSKPPRSPSKPAPAAKPVEAGPSVPAAGATPAAKPKPLDPSLDRSSLRLAASAAMYVVALAVIVHQFQVQGTFSLVASFVRASSPYVQPCGLLAAKEFALMSDRIIGPHGKLQPGVVHVRGGLIADVVVGGPAADRHRLVQSLAAAHPAMPVLDYGDAVVMPGLVDVHVHMNEPGREEWEGMATATRAAAAGGVTTLIDMPLNSSPCTTTPAEVRRKLELAAGGNRTHVDVGLWAGLVPGNARDAGALRALVRAGALGFKAFMAPSGIDDFPHVLPTDVASALPTIRALGVPLLVHAEIVDEDVPAPGNPREHATWLASRPRRFEEHAVRQLLTALRITQDLDTRPGFHLHIVHLADADLLPELNAAKAERLPLTVETCPHYLLFTAERVPEGDTRFKCAPPLREDHNRWLLLQGLKDGSIDSMSSDHSPSEPSLKLLEEGDFMKAWGGIAGLQYALPATWHAWHQAELNLTRLAQAWSAVPARLANLQRHKGRLAPSYDADIVVWNPDAVADTSEAALQHRHKVTPYRDLPIKGRVLATFVRGSQVFAEAQGVAPQACGRAIRAPRRWW